ncbi:MAG: hypothetical protein ABJB69_08935 [Spartobacteria bacterium]
MKNVSLSRRLRAFRQLDHRFTKKERSRYLLAELLLFGLLFVISTWPMLSLLDAMTAL